MDSLVIVFLALFVSVIVFAFWKGGGPERVVAVAFWLASLLTLTVAPRVEVRFQQVGLGVLAVDTILLFTLLAVAVMANRRWTLVVASMQVLIVMAHSAKAILPDLPRSTYAVATAIWPFFQLTILAIGTEFHRRRKKREGYVRSWSRLPRR